MPGLLDNIFTRDPNGQGLFGGLNNISTQGGGIGPLLLSLGAGIASGRNWGEGISRGLAGAADAQQNSMLMDLRRAGLERENQNAEAMAAYRAANLGLREREVGSSEAYRGAQIENLQNPQPKIGEVVESIRRKLATGEQLTPGESKVYEDYLKQDPITRLLQGGGVPGPTPHPVQTVPIAPGMSTGPQPFQPNANLRKLGQVYNLPDGRQALWTQDASGKVGWEVLN